MNDQANNETRAEAGAHPCWSCGTDVSVRAPFCHGCGVIQPPQPLDHFRRLNLPQSYELSRADLERQYFGLQRYFHPDRFAAKSARERALSGQHAVNLNEAYEILKEPLSRAEYLLQLRGQLPHSDGCSTISDPKLLMEAMEMREELADAPDAAQVAAILQRVEGEIAETERGIAREIAADNLDEAAQLCLRLRYLSKLKTEARERRVKFEA